MEDGLDNIGTAITGGLAARLVEPEHGEGRDAHETICANCSTPLIGTYCHLCGQKAHVHRSLSAIGHDLIHGVLHLDGKFWRTLPLLIWRPGELTRRYAHGERAKFVSPLGMFLFSAFLMFAIFAFFGLSLSNLDGPESFMAFPRSTIETQLEEARADLETADGESDLAALKRRVDGLETELVEFDESVSGMEFTLVNEDFKTGWGRLDYGIEKLNENPGLALYKLQANGYKFSWLLIPISAPFVWILFFWTWRFRMYDHTVFVTYSLAFMSLLAVALTLAGFAGIAGGATASAAVLIPPVHIFRQLKGAYRLHWATALIRTFILTMLCFVTATIFFILLLGIGALG